MTVVTSPPPSGIKCTITSGSSLSSGVFVGGKLVGIFIPSAWDAAAITFQSSLHGDTQNANYLNLYDSATGTAAERTIASANIPTSGGRFFALPISDWLGVNWVKVRSGTAASAVNQTADRTIILVLAN